MNRLDTMTPSPDPSESPLPAFLMRRYPKEGLPRHINVGRRERTASIAAGAALVGLGLLRGKLGGLATAALGAMIVKRGLEGHCRVYEALGFDTATEDRPDPTELYNHGVRIHESVIVNRPPHALYDYWQEFSNHTRFMPNVESVRDEGAGRSFWRLRAPGGLIVEYQAEIINDEPGRLIAWRSVAGADIQHAGTVRFIEAADGGTDVQFNVEYLPPAGYVGQFGAKLLRIIGRSPRTDVAEGLRRFKQLMESA